MLCIETGVIAVSNMLKGGTFASQEMPDTAECRTLCALAHKALATWQQLGLGKETTLPA